MVGGSLNTGKNLVFGGFMMVLLVASCVVKVCYCCKAAASHDVLHCCKMCTAESGRQTC